VPDGEFPWGELDLEGFAFRVTPFGEIATVHHKVWLIRDLLGAGELSVIYGAPGSGKSVVVADMAAHVAAGRPWFEQATTQGIVLYIAAERGGLVKRRLAAWRKRHDISGLPLFIIEGIFDFCAGIADAQEVVRIGLHLAAALGLPVVWINPRYPRTHRHRVAAGEAPKRENLVAIR